MGRMDFAIRRSAADKDLSRGARPPGLYRGGNAAPGTELATHHGPDRITSLVHVFKDLIDDVLLENPKIAVTKEVLFDRLEFEATVAGHVADGENAEVGEPCFGADGGEFRIVDLDFIAGKLILPGFNGRKGEVETGLGVIVGVARLLGHDLIVRAGRKAGQDGTWVGFSRVLRGCFESYILTQVV